MAKKSGLGNRFFIHGRNVSGDINSVERIGGGLATVFDFTDITQSAMERGGGARDGGLKFKSYFNDATNRIHDALKSLPRTDVIGMWSLAATIGSVAGSCNGKQGNYDPKRDDNGDLKFDAELLANSYGFEFGNMVTAINRTDTAATNGAGVDFTASSAFGLQAYLQASAFTGTDVTVKLQHSSDDGAGDPYADITGAAFTAITGGTPTAERIQTSRTETIKRYIRAVTTGTFSSFEFNIMVNKNTTSVVF